MFKIIASSNRRAVTRLIARRTDTVPTVLRRVRTIVARVRQEGDRALLRYARRFDRLELPMELGADEIKKGALDTPPELRAALRQAGRHIRTVARRQVPRGWKTSTVPGVTVEQRVTPLDRVGCYVPAGRYPLLSSLLMTAIPARVAGVAEVIAVCSRPEPAVLASAVEAGVTRIFRVGGAHAIAALAYGTATVPRVDKIVGPGNAYVSAAKRLVAEDCPIDFLAGPTEILVLSASGRPDWIAADLLAQAEHDPDSRALMLTPSRDLAVRVARNIAAARPDGPAARALRRNGGAIVTETMAEAIALANEIAPEHLVCDDDRVAGAVTNAGAVFVGPWAAQAAGDYATGSNHVLPTGGAARHRGGLSAADFVRQGSVQRLTREGLSTLAPTIVTLAEAEGLRFHARSIKVRTS